MSLFVNGVSRVIAALAGFEKARTELLTGQEEIHARLGVLFSEVDGLKAADKKAKNALAALDNILGTRAA